MNRKNVYTLIGGMFFISAAYTMLAPFLPLYLIELGVTGDDVKLWNGMVFSVCFFVAGIMGPVWGKLADTRGKKKMVMRAGILIGVSYFLCGLVQNEWQLFGVRAFQGFANGFVAAALAILSQSVPEDDLGTTLGFAQTALIVGGIMGPIMGGFMAEMFGMRYSFFVGAAILWLVTLAVWRFVQDKKIETKEEQGSIADDLRYAYGNGHIRRLLLYYLTFQSGIMMISSITPLYIGELLGTLENIQMTSGMILSLGGIAGAATTALWGKFSQRNGYFFTMTITLSVGGALMALQAFPQTILGFAAFQFAVGCFHIGTNPAMNSAFAKYSPPDFKGRVFGLASTAQQFGNMIGPLLSVVVTLCFPMYTVYLIAGTIQLAVAAYIAFYHLRKGER